MILRLLLSLALTLAVARSSFVNAASGTPAGPAIPSALSEGKLGNSWGNFESGWLGVLIIIVVVIALTLSKGGTVPPPKPGEPPQVP